MSLIVAPLDAAFRQYRPRTVSPDGLAAAAVLLPLFTRNGQDHLLLTRRTDTVQSHKGQICFPGGMAEPYDPDRQATALREASEEVALRPSDVTILGPLDDLVTWSGLHIRPFVGRIPWPYPLHGDPCEVAELLEVPLSDLFDPRNLRCETSPRVPGKTVYFYQSGAHVIWGITGWIVKNFLDVASSGRD